MGVIASESEKVLTYYTCLKNDLEIVERTALEMVPVVLEHLEKNMSTRQIARRLGRSKWTVNSQRKHPWDINFAMKLLEFCSKEGV